MKTDFSLKIDRDTASTTKAEDREDNRSNTLGADPVASGNGNHPSPLNEKMVSYEAEMLQLSQQLSNAEYEVGQKRAMLQWIMSSRSWKLTSWMRTLKFAGQRIKTSGFQNDESEFVGELEQPVEGGNISSFVEISGWAYSVRDRVGTVEVFLDSLPVGTLQYGQQRADISAYPSKAPLNSGYEGKVLIDNSFAGWRELVIRVTDSRGRIRDFRRRLFVDAPFVPVSSRALTREDEYSAVAAHLHDDLSVAKRLQTSLAKISLESFLVSHSPLEFPQVAEPELSIILVLYNRAELTLQCLQSILRAQTNSIEVVIVDNASTDETAELLKRIQGAHVIRNEQNLHYLRACNQAGQQARGKYLLFLNSDAQPEAHSIAAALRTLKSSDDIGAVGGKLLLPDGTVQEAGNIIWQDGSCRGYGRGASPLDPEFMFKRDVDYCSGAFLLTHRDLFLEDGGFDESFLPAYYEDSDYCVRLWQKGKRVVYDPDVVVLHHEFASSASPESVMALQARNQTLFVARHQKWLSQQSPQTNTLFARHRARQGAQRILVLDDRVPHVSFGSGFPRGNRILRHLVELGHDVTFYPLSSTKENWPSVYDDVPREVEVMVDYGLPQLERFLSERLGFYDVVLISRPHNLAKLHGMIKGKPHLFSGVKKIYDAEALFSLRDIERQQLKGKKISSSERQKLVEKEIELAECCDRVISVSELESREFSNYGMGVSVLGHALNVEPTPNGFADRKDLLFVGAIHETTSPNADSVLWFSRKILPRLQKLLGHRVNLSIAGMMAANIEADLDLRSLELNGVVKDLRELYNQRRIFIAPTRFASGLPHKIHEAAAYGVPIVTTSLAGRQLGWRHETELLLADDEQSFAQACARLYQDSDLWHHLRENALVRVANECSPEAFTERLRTIISQPEAPVLAASAVAGQNGRH